MTLTTTALLDMLQNAPDKTAQGIPFSRDHSMGLDFTYKQECENVLRTVPLGIQAILDEDDKSGFVRVLHEAPSLIPEHEAAKRLGNTDIDLTHVRYLKKLNRRVRFKFGKKGQLLDRESFARRLHGIIVGRTHQCNVAFEEARKRKTTELDRREVLAAVLEDISERTGTLVTGNKSLPSGYGGVRIIQGVPLALPISDEEDYDLNENILDVRPQLAQMGYTGHITQRHGYAISIRLVALDDNPQALEKIVKALAQLTSDPDIAVDRGF